MKEKVLKTRINYEQWAEDTPAEHPLEDLTLAEITGLFYELKIEYPDYDDFRYERENEALGFGAEVEWFDLIGLKNEKFKK